MSLRAKRSNRKGWDCFALLAMTVIILVRLLIHLKKDGELNLSGLTLENLSPEEFLVVQQLIDESRARSKDHRCLEELMQRGMMAQTAIAAITIFIFLAEHSLESLRWLG
jgi:hypothetical protein